MTYMTGPASESASCPHASDTERRFGGAIVYDGPYSGWITGYAATLIGRLSRYLANAT